MTNEDKLNKAIDKKLQLLEALDQESTQVQIYLEMQEVIKTEYSLKWLLSIADERKNKKLYDCITLLSKRFKRYSKLISDLKHYEHKAVYYEMMYNSMIQYKKENEILRSKLIEKGI